jgi:hypothetical protein
MKYLCSKLQRVKKAGFKEVDGSIEEVKQKITKLIKLIYNRDSKKSDFNLPGLGGQKCENAYIKSRTM